MAESRACASVVHGARQPLKGLHRWRGGFSNASSAIPRASSQPWIIVLAVLGVACGSPYPPSPETAQDPVVDTLHGVVFTDPYRWLEDQDSPETRAWIAKQNAHAEQIVGESTLRTGLEARLRELMDGPGAVYPRRNGEFEYFSFRKPGGEVSAIYRRPAPEEPDDGPLDVTADYEVVIDPLELRADGTTSIGIQGFSPDGGLLLYSIRDGGRDELEVRVRDLSSGEDLPDGLPTALYSSVAFTSDGTGFY